MNDKVIIEENSIKFLNCGKEEAFLRLESDIHPSVIESDEVDLSDSLIYLTVDSEQAFDFWFMTRKNTEQLRDWLTVQLERKV